MNEKIKVIEKPEIVVHGTVDKPYFEIRYHEVGKEECNIGYSSYDLRNCFEWLESEFEVGEVPTAEGVVAVMSFEDVMGMCRCCERYMTCPHLHDRSCRVMLAKIKDTIVGTYGRSGEDGNESKSGNEQFGVQNVL